MWRFLNNIPRALKNYHGPRASIGVYVDSDDKEQEAAESSQHCVAQPKRENCLCPFKNANIKGTAVLWRLVGRKREDKKSGGADGQQDQSGRSQEKQQECWWSGCQKDFWTFLQGPNRIYEAVAAGSSFLWNPDHKKKGHRHELVYKVLFSVCGEDTAVKTIISCRDETGPELPKVLSQPLLAIKDTSGSEQDRIVNQAKSVTLDAALQEFDHICADYSSQNESLLGIMAADRGDMAEAISHFQTACRHGNKTACFNIGLCYEMGTGVTRNLDKAKHYYELAAVKGHVQAMFNLSQLYLREDGLVEGRGDKGKGLEWMSMAARTGLVQAQKYMGVYCMEEAGDAKKAVAYFRAAAGQNDSEAQYFLALCHEHGLGVVVNECWAAHLYSLAAIAGHNDAICSLARFHQHGLGGIPSDVTAAHELYTRAARLGNEEAKEWLRDSKQHKANAKVFPEVEDSNSQPIRSSLLNSSSSSPNLGHLDFSLTDWVYQRVRGLYRACSHADHHEIVFDPVSFKIGSDEVCPVITDPMATADAGQTWGSSPPTLHKSNTTPHLPSMVACNI